jgi:hypothetical protein
MIVEGVMSGMHRSPYQGMAVEFAQHRQYTAGDDLKHLDWKVYGRSDKLYIKQYQQETNLDVIVLIDASASMAYGTLEVKAGWGGTTASQTRNRWTTPQRSPLLSRTCRCSSRTAWAWRSSRTRSRRWSSVPALAGSGNRSSTP